MFGSLPRRSGSYSIRTLVLSSPLSIRVSLPSHKIRSPSEHHLLHAQMSVSIRTTCRNFASRRLLSTTTCLRVPTPFGAGPAPPRLPEEEQKLYEKLQRSSTGAFSTPRPTVVVNQSPATSQLEPSRPQINQSPHADTKSTTAQEREVAAVDARVRATGDGEELHPDIRRGVQPEFEGEKNPKTGEIGGPKNEPLRWGGEVDWSYNGRVTDF